MGINPPSELAWLTTAHHRFRTEDTTMTTTANAVETITLNVAGMTCGSCERHIKKELDQVPGYRDAKVDLAGGRVNVTYEPGAATPEQLVGAVIRAGYPAEVAAAAAEVQSGGPKACGCCTTKNA